MRRGGEKKPTVTAGEGVAILDAQESMQEFGLLGTSNIHRRGTHAHCYVQHITQKFLSRSIIQLRIACARRHHSVPSPFCIARHPMSYRTKL